MNFTSFRMGIRVTIPSLSNNLIYTLKSFSAVEEAVRFLNCFEENHKTRIIHEQMKSSSSQKLGTKIYEPKTIVRAFNYFTTSRALYTQQLREDFALPSVSTLTKITSSLAQKEDSVLLKRSF